MTTAPAPAADCARGLAPVALASISFPVRVWTSFPSWVRLLLLSWVPAALVLLAYLTLVFGGAVIATTVAVLYYARCTIGLALRLHFVGVFVRTSPDLLRFVMTVAVYSVVSCEGNRLERKVTSDGDTREPAPSALNGTVAGVDTGTETGIGLSTAARTVGGGPKRRPYLLSFIMLLLSFIPGTSTNPGRSDVSGRNEQSESFPSSLSLDQTGTLNQIDEATGMTPQSAVGQSNTDECSCSTELGCHRSECGCFTGLDVKPATSDGYCEDCSGARASHQNELTMDAMEEDPQEEFNSHDPEVVRWDAGAGSGPSSDANGIFLSALANLQAPTDRAPPIQTPTDQRHFLNLHFTFVVVCNRCWATHQALAASPGCGRNS